jgi:hypothetical protein
MDSGATKVECLPAEDGLGAALAVVLDGIEARSRP